MSKDVQTLIDEHYSYLVNNYREFFSDVYNAQTEEEIMKVIRNDLIPTDDIDNILYNYGFFKGLLHAFRSMEK